MPILFRYRDRGDHNSYRNCSQHDVDPRDIDQKTGKPPPWMKIGTPIPIEEGEIEFDHEPSEDELDAAFPNRKKASP